MGFLPFAALAAGLIGSGHCVAMCGGIASALGMHSATRKLRTTLLYQLGRLTSYAVLGAAGGYLGAGLAATLGGARSAQYLRVAAAAALILVGARVLLADRARWLQGPERWGAVLWRRAAPALMRKMPRSPVPRALAIGAIWGWLPCGLVYSMLLVAAFSGGPLQGAGTLFAFGLGTVPAVATVQILGNRFGRSGALPRRVLGAALIACGLWTALIPVSALAAIAAHCRTLIP